MSIPTKQPIKIWINWGDAKGKPKIQAALHGAIIRVLRKAKLATEQIMREVVPESEVAVGRYSAKQKELSEGLLSKAKIILEQSFHQQKVGGYKPRYFLRLGFPAKYAKYISRMNVYGVWSKQRGRGWSKAGSQRNFFSLSKLKLITTFREGLKEELERQPKLKPYIGAKKLG